MMDPSLARKEERAQLLDVLGRTKLEEDDKLRIPNARSATAPNERLEVQQEVDSAKKLWDEQKRLDAETTHQLVEKQVRDWKASKNSP